MNIPHRRVRSLAPLAIASLTATLLAQAAGVPPQGGRGGGVFAPITDVAYSDYSGYTSLWDGRTLEGWDGGDLVGTLSASRRRDVAAGRTTEGPHRHDLAVVHRAKQMPAAQSSTGEQKALLLGLVLAHSELVAERRGEPPILLLDEVAAHLDPVRRAALFARLEGHGQVWMTATEAALFEGIGHGSRFHVEPGRISPT